MRYIVTGGTGFVGSAFIDLAIRNGIEVIAVRRSDMSIPSIDFKSQPNWINADLDKFNISIQQDDVIFHFAGAGVSPKKADWSECMDVNFRKSFDFVINMIECGAKNLMLFGTSLEYGLSANDYRLIPPAAPLKPVGAYSTSKALFSLAVQNYAKDRDARLAYMRLFSVYGDGQFHMNLWPSLKKAALAGMDYDLTAGDQLRDYIHIDDLVKKIISFDICGEVSPGCPVVKNIASGNPVRVKDFASHWWKKWNAIGSLNIGAVPYRKDELMSMLPLLT